MTPASHKIKAFDSLEGIHASDWGQLSNRDFPFTDYAYLYALEKSGAVGGASGWTPHYLTAWEGENLEGASFLYSKEHSHGEYIFDWDWADAYQRHGIAYYPKLISSIPFTPATGPKLLFSKGALREAVASRLISAAKERMEQQSHSSLHYLFVPSEEVPYFEREGFLIRHSFQYHWKNQGYSRFEDFLAALKPHKRKQILRERKQLGSENLKFRVLTGEELWPEHATTFHRFYLSTIEKMEAIPYLSLEFFQLVFESMREEIVLILAEDQGTPIAGSLCYKKGDCLFGRYWGAIRKVRNLHFELCYYQPLEWAISRKIKLFEAGAQGEHKFSRGFLPELTFSAHWICHPRFREAIARFIEEEKKAIQGLFEEIESHHPYG